MSALTLACSECDTTVVFYAACEMGDFTPKIDALFILTIEDRYATSAAVLVELIAGIDYLVNWLLTMLVDLFVFCNQGANLVYTLQKIGAPTLFHEWHHCDSSVLSSNGDSVEAVNGDFSYQSTFDLLQIEYAVVKIILGEDFEILNCLSVAVICHTETQESNPVGKW